MHVTRSSDDTFADNLELTTSGADPDGQVPASLSFTASETSKNFPIALSPDNVAEGDQTAGIALGLTRSVQPGAAPRRAIIPPANGSVEITLLDSPSQSWFANNVGNGTINNSDWFVDGDNDGLIRAFEALFGGTEGNDDSALLPSLQTTASALELHFQRDTSITDLTPAGLRSQNLIDWFDDGMTLERVGDENPGGLEDWKLSLPQPFDNNTEHFFRLNIEELQPE